jgi:hypothetical protein
MKGKTKTHKLNRYTSLPVLLDILQTKQLTLLNPKLWDDKNDSEAVFEYKKRKGVKGIFVGCFSYGDETVHHWKTFSHGSSGCCIQFNTNRLLSIIDKIPGARYGKVLYSKLSDIESGRKTIKLDKIPFTKRWPYRCEEEYRVIIESDLEDSFYKIGIPLNVISRITFSQQMPKEVFENIKRHLTNLNDDPERKINRSTLYENQRWIKQFKII